MTADAPPSALGWNLDEETKTNPGTLVLTPRKQQAPGEKFVTLRALLANSYHSIARGDVTRVTPLKISSKICTHARCQRSIAGEHLTGEFFNQSKRGPQDPLIGARGLTPAAQEVGANQAGLVSGRSIGWQTSLRRQNQTTH